MASSLILYTQNIVPLMSGATGAIIIFLDHVARYIQNVPYLCHCVTRRSMYFAFNMITHIIRYVAINILSTNHSLYIENNLITV
jgi:hypothetical protein